MSLVVVLTVLTVRPKRRLSLSFWHRIVYTEAIFGRVYIARIKPVFSECLMRGPGKHGENSIIPCGIIVILRAMLVPQVVLWPQTTSRAMLTLVRNDRINWLIAPINNYVKE